MAHFLTEEETLDRDGLAALQRRKLGAMLHDVLVSNPFYQQKFSGFTPDAIINAFEQIPFTTRNEIEKDQRDHPPYGTNITYPQDRYIRCHQTSGSSGSPLRWLDTEESWSWWKRCWSVIYRASGVTSADRILFPFSFGPFIGFWSAYESASDQGYFSLPAGGMTTVARLRYLVDHRVTVVCCTPTYALRMAEVAGEEGMDLAGTSVRILIVAGEPGGHIPSTKSRIESAWGAKVFDHPGMTEIGAWGFTCEESPGGVHVMESEFIAEVIDPATCEPVADGMEGELVLTNLGRWGSPLIRYRTGDQVTFTKQQCTCGRWFARAQGGISGRIDEMVVIRGNNVYPASIENILRNIDTVSEFQMEVEQSGSMADLLIRVEPVSPGDVSEMAGRVRAEIQNQLHFKPRVLVVEPGSLPRFEMKAKRWIHRSAEP